MSSKTSSRAPWRNDAFWFDGVLALVAVGIAQFIAWHDFGAFGATINVNKTALYGIAAQVAAAIFGFTIAGAAIISSSSTLANVKAQNFQVYKALVNALRNSLYVALVALMYFFLGPLFDHSNDNAFPFVIAIGLMVLLGLRSFRVARRLSMTMLL